MGQVIDFLADTYQNLVTGLGLAKDRTTHGEYGLKLLDDAQLIAAYRCDWIARKVVDVPAFDMTRAGRNWQADDQDIEKLELAERRLQVRAKVLRALKLARLYGGSAMFMVTTDGPSTDQPLRAAGIGADSLKALHVLPRTKVTCGELDGDPYSPTFGEPSYYEVTARNGRTTRFHPSRVIRFIGAEVPEEMQANLGWGDSVLLAVDDAVKNAALTAGGIASLVPEAKVDLFKLPDLTKNILNPDYRNRVIARFTLANQTKSTVNALVMDAAEEWQQKQISFDQLPQLLQAYLQIAAGAADIPATRLLGQAPAGMNATGESDIRNYYDRLSGEQELNLRPCIERLDEVLIPSALGARPSDVYWNFAPLWQMSEKERADIFKAKADAARAIAGTGGTSPALMPIEALSDALVNTFVEDGSLPGLEAAIEEFGRLADQPEDEPEDIEGAVAPPVQQAPEQRRAANDATPRTLYVSRKLLNAQEVIDWAKGQGFETTLPAEDLHVTIAYSRDPVDWMKVGEAWTYGDGKGNLTVNPGGPRLMEQFGEAVVLLFSSTDLQWRHMAIREAGASWDHPEYQPHVTITYQLGDLDLSKVEPYRGRLVFGPERFEEVRENWAETLAEV